MAAVDLNALLQAAGASLGDAQGQLLTGVNAPPTMMAIAEATLDMKVTIDGAARGALQVVPVSAADARTGAINVGALSSVSMRFVAFGNDVPGQIASAPAAPAGDPPVRTPGTGTAALTRDAALRAFQARPDIARRIAAGERLKFDAIQAGVAGDAAWIVTARAASGAPIAVASFAAKV
ncbi:MAG: hypothetical protein ACRYG4_21000 [Janthinobacterium lividum]